MSGAETHKGRLIPIPKYGRCNFFSLESRAECVCKLLEYERQDYHTSWVDCLQDFGYGEVFINGGTIYKVEDEELDPYGFAEATLNEDGSIDYFISYYNGGACFEEVIEAALGGMHKEES